MDTFIAVELDTKQAEFLRLCNAHYATIGFMFKEGVFTIRNGNALLSFDKAGELRTIKRELFSYL